MQFLLIKIKCQRQREAFPISVSFFFLLLKTQKLQHSNSLYLFNSVIQTKKSCMPFGLLSKPLHFTTVPFMLDSHHSRLVATCLVAPPYLV